MAKFFDYILQGSDATEENAIQAARSLDWQEMEVVGAHYPNLQYIGTLNGVGIHYNYGDDSYYFTEEDSEDDYELEVKEKEPFNQVDSLEDLGSFGLNENRKTIKITTGQLQKIIKEGVARLHRKSLIENRINKINEELSSLKPISENNEVASPRMMDILNSYLEAALWTEEEEIGPSNIESDVSDNSKIDAYKDVRDFLNKAGDLVDGLEPSQIGHDLWLTRNGHGSGFWDRGLGEIGNELSDIARSMGSKHVYIGDDEQIHID
jgi:hypothetical protein